MSVKVIGQARSSGRSSSFCIVTAWVWLGPLVRQQGFTPQRGEGAAERTRSEPRTLRGQRPSARRPDAAAPTIAQGRPLRHVHRGAREGGTAPPVNTKAQTRTRWERSCSPRTYLSPHHRQTSRTCARVCGLGGAAQPQLRCALTHPPCAGARKSSQWKSRLQITTRQPTSPATAAGGGRDWPAAQPLRAASSSSWRGRSPSAR